MDEIKVQEELAFIKKVMEDTKQSFIHDGKPFIIWGVLVIIGQLGTYYAEITHNFQYIWYLWGILAFAGWISSYVNYKKGIKQVRAATLIGKAINAVWLSCGITIMLFVFIVPFLSAYFERYTNPIASAIIGIAYFTTGSVSYKWLRYVAAGWWLGSLIMFTWPGIYNLLLMAAMMLVFQVTSGFIIYKQWKKSALAK